MLRTPRARRANGSSEIGPRWPGFVSWVGLGVGSIVGMNGILFSIGLKFAESNLVVMPLFLLKNNRIFLKICPISFRYLFSKYVLYAFFTNWFFTKFSFSKDSHTQTTLSKYFPTRQFSIAFLKAYFRLKALGFTERIVLNMFPTVFAGAVLITIELKIPYLSFMFLTLFRIFFFFWKSLFFTHPHFKKKHPNTTRVIDFHLLFLFHVFLEF